MVLYITGSRVRELYFGMDSLTSSKGFRHVPLLLRLFQRNCLASDSQSMDRLHTD